MKLNTAAQRTIEIITFMSERKKPMTLAEISHGCEIPKSSALDLLYTLQENGIIQLDNEQFKTYILTTKLYQLGAGVLNQDLQNVSEKILHKLAHQTNSTVFLAIPQNDKVLYIKKMEGAVTIQSACSIGDSNAMYCTGLGKAMMATYSDEKILKMLGEGPYLKKTEHTLTTYDELIADLRETRKRGYAVDDREGVNVIYCYAAPVYDYTGNMVGAISNVNLYSELTESDKQEYPQLVMEAAKEISRQLGYTKEKTYE